MTDTTTKSYTLNYPKDKNVVVFAVDEQTQQVCIQYHVSLGSRPYGEKHISIELARAKWDCYVRYGWTRIDQCYIQDSSIKETHNAI